MLWMSMTTITIILLVAVQSMFGSTTTHALPWAGVGQTEPQWPVVLFLKKYQSSDQDRAGDGDGDDISLNGDIMVEMMVTALASNLPNTGQ